MYPRLVALPFLLVFGLASCSLTGGGSNAGGSSSGEVGDSCERATDCRGELICDPAANECAEAVSCSEHAECGIGAHCAESGECTVSTTGSPCDDDDDCARSDNCIGGVCACRGETFEGELVDVNMMILLDRSYSMHWRPEDDTGEDEPVGADDPESRWQIALGAIDALLDAFDDDIAFGLAVYPHSSFTSGFFECDDPENLGCQAGDVLVDVKDAAAAEIRAALASTAPFGCTPSGQSITSVAAEASLNATDATNYILYVTDGVQNCDSDQRTAVAALRELEPEIRTFVVGFTPDISFNTLNATAVAGGTARDGGSDEPKFYEALDAETLEQALADIANRALDCSYELDGVPSNPDLLEVYVDGELLDRDPQRNNGWDYDPDTNRVTVYGPACEGRIVGAQSVSIVQSCPVVID
jgi:hypothetical protein